VIQQVKEGKLRMLATTTAQRTRFTPEVPTMRELGLTRWCSRTGRAWWRRPARRATSVARANAAVADVIRSPAGAAAMVNLGAEADPAFAGGIRRAVPQHLGALPGCGKEHRFHGRRLSAARAFPSTSR
jgi:tripartite-type tricarboxylate transporter receptor subunit TctC